jgi:ankyrin repeat protein
MNLNRTNKTMNTNKTMTTNKTRGLNKPQKPTRTLYRAAQIGVLDKFPPELLTETSLGAKDKRGFSPLHYAAFYGFLDQIPKTLFSQANLLDLDARGNTVLHTAAHNRQLDQIPGELLTPAMWHSENTKGWSVLDVAVYRGDLRQVPKELLTEANLLVWDIKFPYGALISNIASRGQLDCIPQEWLSFERVCTSSSSYPVLHLAAMNGSLEQIPSRFLTTDHFLLRGPDGETVLHCASRYRRLHRVPPNLITKELLLAQNSHGKTVLASAAQQDELNFIDPKLFVKDFKAVLAILDTVLGETKPKDEAAVKLQIRDWLCQVANAALGRPYTAKP